MSRFSTVLDFYKLGMSSLKRVSKNTKLEQTKAT